MAKIVQKFFLICLLPSPHDNIQPFLNKTHHFLPWVTMHDHLSLRAKSMSDSSGIKYRLIRHKLSGSQTFAFQSKGKKKKTSKTKITQSIQHFFTEKRCIYRKGSVRIRDSPQNSLHHSDCLLWYKQNPCGQAQWTIIV